MEYWGGGGEAEEAEGEREKRVVVMMEQQAMEELEIMEAQHPNRFKYLKLELRSFISLLQNNESPKTTLFQSDYFLDLPILDPSASVPDTSLLTQESSTRKKRKKGGSSLKRQTAKEKLLLQRRTDDGCGGNHRKRREEGVDAAIEKAQACLLKIQQFKTSFEITVRKNR